MDRREVGERMNIDKALTVEGYMSAGELAWLAEGASHSRVIAEIGSWKGRSACALAANTSGIVVCVDTWSGSLETSDVRDDEMFNAFIRNTSEFKNVWPLRCESIRAVEIFKRSGIRPDMVFLDGDHNADHIRADIDAWYPLISQGGVLCGHDYGYPGWPDVEVVVRERIPNYQVVETIWWCFA